VEVHVIRAVAMESYITAAGSEKSSPEAAIRGRPKKPVLPTAVATISAPARGRSIPQTRVASHESPRSRKWIAKAAIGTRIRASSRSASIRIRKTSAGRAR
jgi:hypothetical protein